VPTACSGVKRSKSPLFFVNFHQRLRKCCAEARKRVLSVRTQIGRPYFKKRGFAYFEFHVNWASVGSHLKPAVNKLLRTGALAAVCFLAGCGTPFKYNPQHARSYSSVQTGLGVEIAGGADQRPEDARRPDWSKSVEVIVARALADEIEQAKLFQRVKIHLSGPSRLNKYSYFVTFHVEAFEMAPQAGTLEHFGRTALGALGWRGALISASIPTTWESNVKVEFEVFDAATKQQIFGRSYSESRSLKSNGYQGKTRQIQQTSDCLEAVVGRFVGDFSGLVAAKNSPFIR
jgi:hypothetical protein